MLLFIILFLYINTTRSLRTPCADQTQRCGILIEDFEKQIQDIKALAFRKCFLHPACLQEKIAFDDCYSKAIRAVRAPFNGETAPNDGFFDSSERFRAQIEQCIGEPESEPFNVEVDTFEDEIILFEELIFSTELSDRMWYLPENGSTFKKSCSYRDFGRLYGNGISRILDSSKITINNLNTSCILKQDEVNCYHKTLINDDKYQLLLKNKKQILHGCIQSIRLQSNCKGSESVRLNQCLCEAKEEFYNRIQASLLECTRKSDIGKLYAELLQTGIDQSKLNNNNDDAIIEENHTVVVDVKDDGEAKKVKSHRYHPQSIKDQNESPSTISITHGTMLGGQCLCACPSINLQKKMTFSSYSTDQKSQTVPSTVANVPPQTSTNVMSSSYNGYTGGYYPQSYYTRSSVVDPLTAVEMGVSDGFQRFFNGQPPPIK